VLVWTCAWTLIKGPQRGRHPPVPHIPTCSSLAATMGAKNRGPIPCTLCDYRFASIPNLQQVSCFPTFSVKFTDFSPQHVRDKHNINVKTQAPTVQVQPPAQEPKVKAKSEPKVQPKNEPQVQAKSKPQVQTKSKPQVQTKSEPQVQTKSKPQVQAKSKPQVQTKSEPQVQTKSEPPHTVRTSPFYGQRPSAKAGVSLPLPPRIRQHANIASPISPPR